MPAAQTFQPFRIETGARERGCFPKAEWQYPTSLLLGLMMRPLAFLLCWLALGVNFSAAADWGTVGIGNAKCKHWKEAAETTKLAALSWIDGYVSGFNHSLAADGRPELDLRLWTREFARREVEAACALPSKENESLVGVAIDIIGRFPRAKQ
jgi:hypothetical protein